MSDATGVSAVDSGGTLLFTSSDYGSDAFVSVKVLSGDDDDTFADGLSGRPATEGTDIVATVNGILASGKGNTLAINTATLDLDADGRSRLRARDVELHDHRRRCACSSSVRTWSRTSRPASASPA